MLSYFKEVEICDELESFFYVILYYAVRYLRSNIPRENVGDWIHYFFDTYGVSGDTYVCGQVKLSTIENGKLIVSAGKTLKFYSPIDGVLADLLSWFKAHHAVMMYEMNSDQLETIPEVASQQLRTRSPARLVALPTSDSDDSDDSESEESDVGTPQGSVRAPSQLEWTLYEKVVTHDAMLKRLKKAIRVDPHKGQGWTSNDKLGERIPENWQPPEQEFGPTEPASMVRAKRARLDGQVGPYHLSLVGLPSRPPKTPPRRPAPNTTGYAKVRRR